MKIDELISELEEKKEEHGNLETTIGLRNGSSQPGYSPKTEVKEILNKKKVYL